MTSFEPNERAKVAATARDTTRIGIFLVLGGCFMLSAKDATTKLVTAQLPVGQVLFLQGILILAILLLVAPRTRFRRMFSIRNWRMHALRTVLVVGNMFLFVTGLQLLPFSLAVTIAFVNPLYVTALAPLILGEHVGWRRWAAVTVGFGGVVLVAWPEGDDLSWAILFPLLGALAGALRDVVTRLMAPDESSEAMLFTSVLAMTAAGLVVSLWVWVPVDLETMLILLVSALAQLISLYLMIEAYRYAEAAVIAPFKYSLLLWVICFDLLIWDHLPTWNLFAGAAIIILSILYIVHRERAGNTSIVTKE